MISEKKINKLIEVVNRKTEKANRYFLEEIGKSIKEIKQLTPSEAHKLVQMLKYGSKYQDILVELSNITKISKKDLEKIYSNYARNDTNFYKNFYKYRNKPFIPFDENIALKRQTTALAELSHGKLKSYARTKALGYSFKDYDGVVRFHGLKQTYDRVLDEAVLNISQGKESFDASMMRILNEIGSSGLKTLDYESGRTYRLDSAIEMHLRSAMNNLHNENQKIIAKDIKADGVEISVHLNPAKDHEEVQGRQFTTNKYDDKGKLIEEGEWEKLQKGEEAKDYQGNSYSLVKSNTGSYRPISEYNCYHYVFAIILGVSRPVYTDKELKDIIKKNNDGFVFEGVHYTNYQGTQLQRTIERKIREQQDIQLLARESNNFDMELKSQKTMNELLKKYKDLSKASKLPMNTRKLSTYDYRYKKVA